MKAMTEELPSRYQGPMEFPMKTVAQSCRNVLLRIAGGADWRDVTSPQSWQKVVAGCGHMALMNADITTLASLALRVQRRRGWWVAITGLGLTSARRIEAFFAEHPALLQQVSALVRKEQQGPIVPWERLSVPEVVDGSLGMFRAPKATCILRANNDYEAIQAWLSLHESTSTRRAYRKEAERLMLWVIIERGIALSSMTTEDAVSYRSFLRQPTPRMRWVGPARPRHTPEWRPFTGGLSPRSIAYAFSVLGAMFHWLIQQRYLLANPFAGIKVKGASRTPESQAQRVFSEGEWALIQSIANGLEWSYGWSPLAVGANSKLTHWSFFGWRQHTRPG